MNKEELRKEFLNKRKSMSNEEVEDKSKIIREKLLESNEYKGAKTIMLYVSVGNEVDTLKIMEDALKTKKVLIPKMIKENNLNCCQFNSMDELSPGKYGILENECLVQVNVKDVDLIIVPGVVFDRKNDRLGLGKGYYDKLLKDCVCPKIGICYDFQVIEEVPTDSWDIRMDKLIIG